MPGVTWGGAGAFAETLTEAAVAEDGMPAVTRAAVAGAPPVADLADLAMPGAADAGVAMPGAADAGVAGDERANGVMPEAGVADGDPSVAAAWAAAARASSAPFLAAPSAAAAAAARAAARARVSAVAGPTGGGVAGTEVGICAVADDAPEPASA
jgi:hypothetical protein